MAAKDVKFGRDARERILAGVDTLDASGFSPASTLSPMP